MPDFQYTERDRERWAQRVYVALGAATLAVRERMAAALANGVVPSAEELYDPKWWDEAMAAHVNGAFYSVAYEAAELFALENQLDVDEDWLIEIAILIAAGAVLFISSRSDVIRRRADEVLEDTLDTLDQLDLAREILESTPGPASGPGSAADEILTRVEADAVEKLADTLGVRDGSKPGPASEGIARTVSTGASTHLTAAAADEVIRKTEVQGYKIWNCLFLNSRDSHMAADGQKVAVNELFEVGTSRGRYPGDPDLPIEEVANCNCWLTYEIVEPALEIPEAIAAAAFGGPGSGPRPGHRSPWYERGSKRRMGPKLDLLIAAARQGAGEENPAKQKANKALLDKIGQGIIGTEKFAGMDVVASVEYEREVTYGDGQVSPEKIYLHGDILGGETRADGARRVVGSVTRVFEPGHPERVEHFYLRLNEEERGKGFATEFNQHMEDWYRANGVNEIRLSAGLADGPRVWAQAGYDWDPEERGTNAEFIAQFHRETRDTSLAKRLMGNPDAPDFPTPYDLVTSEGGVDIINGLAAEDFGWLGVKYLNPDIAAGIAASPAATWLERYQRLADVAAAWDHDGEEEASTLPLADEEVAMLGEGAPEPEAITADGAPGWLTEIETTEDSVVFDVGVGGPPGTVTYREALDPGYGNHALVVADEIGWPDSSIIWRPTDGGIEGVFAGSLDQTLLAQLATEVALELGDEPPGEVVAVDEYAVFGGPGSGPRPGHKSSWYERGSKRPGFTGYTPKVKKGPTGALSGRPYRVWAATFSNVVEMRTAAETLLGQAPVGVRPYAEVDPDTIEHLASGDLADATEPGVVEARAMADNAVTLLTQIHRAPTVHERLYRGISLRESEIRDFRSAHMPGDTFDMALASTSGEEATAMIFADTHAWHDSTRIIMEIEPGSRSYEAPRDGMDEYVASGRFEVTGWETRSGLEGSPYEGVYEVMKVRQLGGFNPADGSYESLEVEAVAAAFGTPNPDYTTDPFWEAFGPGPFGDWPTPDDVLAEMGGPGSGPRPGVKSPWYERGSRKGITIPTHAVAPDGSPADNGRFGRAFETIMLDRIAPEIARDLAVDGIQRISSDDGGSTTTPIDIMLGDPAQKGKHYAGELKTQHVNKTEYKVSVSAAAKRRKIEAARETGAVPITVLQIVDQEKGKAYVHVMTDQFKSFRAGRPGGTSNREPEYTYDFTPEDYADAYEQAGPSDG